MRQRRARNFHLFFASALVALVTAVLSPQTRAGVGQDAILTVGPGEDCDYDNLRTLIMALPLIAPSGSIANVLIRVSHDYEHDGQEILLARNRTTVIGGHNGCSSNSVIGRTTLESNFEPIFRMTARNSDGGVDSGRVVTVRNFDLINPQFVVEVEDAGTVNIESSSLSGGFGLSADNVSQLRLTDVEIFDNIRGARINDAIATITRSTFRDNGNVEANGGAVNCNQSNLTFIDSTISDNVALQGGGLSINECNLNLDNVEVSGNVATRVPEGETQGGGIFCTGSMIFATNSLRITNNSAQTQGGGVFLRDCEFVIGDLDPMGEPTVISDNRVLTAGLDSKGGGIYGDDDCGIIFRGSMQGITIADNSVGVDGPPPSLDGLTGNGGGVYVGSCRASFESVAFVRNVAPIGGGIATSCPYSLAFYNSNELVSSDRDERYLSVFEDNHATGFLIDGVAQTGRGAAIFEAIASTSTPLDSGPSELSVLKTVVRNNHALCPSDSCASNPQSAIVSLAEHDAGTLISNSLFVGNLVESGGAIFYLDDGDFRFRNNTVAGNEGAHWVLSSTAGGDQFDHNLFWQPSSLALIAAPVAPPEDFSYNLVSGLDELRAQFGTLVVGNDNIEADPEFVAALQGNFRLKASSPGVDVGPGITKRAGSGSGITKRIDVFDLDGRERPANATAPQIPGLIYGDVGAYELPDLLFQNSFE